MQRWLWRRMLRLVLFVLPTRPAGSHQDAQVQAVRGTGLPARLPFLLLELLELLELFRRIELLRQRVRRF
jgi:hypothetical protein